MNLDLVSAISVAISLFVGFFLRNRTWYQTKFIPVASIVVAVVTRVAADLMIPPPPSPTPLEGVSLAGFSWSVSLNWLVTRILEAIIATGVHSAPKNIFEGLAAQQAAKLRAVK